MELALFLLILLAGFYMAWNIGANDVANAMGTAVGSGALTLRQAVLIAGVMEFIGAYFFGTNVSETVQTGIVSPEVFQQDWHLLVYGMLAALMAAGTWLQVASYNGWPVSTTHTIVGAIAGFGAIVGGLHAVQWGNMGRIVASWILSPLLGGLLAYVAFTFLRKKILYAAHPLRASKKLIPFLTFILIGSLTLLILSRQSVQSHWDLSSWELLLFSSMIGFICAIICSFTLRHIQSRPLAETDQHPDYLAVEKAFGYVQMMSACLMAFSHGANDVANAIGPLSAAVVTLQQGALPMQTTIPPWTLFLGGAGIVIGLATWGWRVIETIGRRITELTPTRGFAAELGASITIITASKLRMPISTTHTLVGAVIGVGMARGIGALNLSTIRDIALSWVVTVPSGAILAVVYFYLLQWVFG